MPKIRRLLREARESEAHAAAQRLPEEGDTSQVAADYRPGRLDDAAFNAYTMEASPVAQAVVLDLAVGEDEEEDSEDLDLEPPPPPKSFSPRKISASRVLLRHLLTGATAAELLPGRSTALVARSRKLLIPTTLLR